jgi:hypothetical protein
MILEGARQRERSWPPATTECLATLFRLTQPVVPKPPKLSKLIAVQGRPSAKESRHSILASCPVETLLRATRPRITSGKRLEHGGNSLPAGVPEPPKDEEHE